MENKVEEPFEIEEWVPLSLTLVEYPKGDPLGKFLAMVSLLPFAIAILHFGVFCILKDWHTFFYGVGIILNHMINFVLKTIIKQPRPTVSFRNLESAHHHMVYGMPSTHAQFMCFALFYMFLFVLFRLPNDGGNMEKVCKTSILTVYSFATVLVLYSRVYLMYHTVEQVFYGAIIGMLLGYVWFWVVQNVLTKWFATLSSWYFADLVGMNDLTNIPNVGRFINMSLKKEAVKRQRKKSRQE